MADRCTVHTHEKLQFFCTVCDLPVCSECLLDRHNGHNMVRLTDAMVSRHVEGRNMEEKGRKVADTMVRNIDTLNQRGEDIERQQVDVENQITAAAAKLVDSIEREKVALINEVREIYNEETRRMGECAKEVESRLSDVLAALEQLQVRGQGESTAMLDKFSELMNENEPALPPRTVIEFHSQKYENVSHLLGKISTTKKAVAKEKSKSQGAFPKEKSKSQGASPKEKSKSQGASPRHFPRTSPRAVPPASSGSNVTAKPTSPRPHVPPKSTTSIGSGHLVSPLKIALSRDNTVFVLDREGGGSVKSFNLDGSVVQSFPLKLADSKKYEVGEGGLFVNGKGQVVFVGFARPLSGSLGEYIDLMCRYEQDGKILHREELQLNSKQAWDAVEISDRKIAVALDWMISIIDETGRELSCFSTSVPDFCCLAYNKTTQDLVVSRFHDHFVEVYKMDGSVRYQIGTEGSGDGEFMGPLGVWVDMSGQILAADWSNRRVQMFDQKGRWLRHVVTSRDGLEEPRAVVQMPDARVLVSDTKKNCVFVFTF